MRKIYNIFLFILFSSGVYSQVGDFVLDKNHLTLTIQNSTTRLMSSYIQQNSASNMKEASNSMHEKYATILFIQNQIENSLFNVNSALKNAKAVQNIPLQITEIYNELRELVELCNQHPQYAFLGREYLQYGAEQAIALNNEVQKFALSGAKNIMMNYRERDQVIREVQVRLSLIRANIQLVKITVRRAVKIGFLRAATPFGNWINNDVILVKDIIKRSKYL